MWKNNGLSIVLFILFAVTLGGHSIAGWKTYNHDQQEHRASEVGYVEYLETSDFGESVFENWESEFLQMAFYILLTVALYQKGSAESKSPGEKEEVDEDPDKHRDDPHAPGPVKAGGWRLALYRNSLSIALLLLFLVSFLGHAAAGARHYTQEGHAHGARATVGMFGYMMTAQFWFESFQNWQSEFLSVFAIVVLSIWLRQWGSPESKPVHTPHHESA